MVGMKVAFVSSSFQAPTASLIHGLSPHLAPKGWMLHPSLQQKPFVPLLKNRE